jgi:hypothetical protein
MLSLLLTVCSGQDADLSKQIIGTWTSDDKQSTETYAPDGSFLTLTRASNHTNSFAGTWQIKDGIMIETFTNAPFHLTGQIFQYRIHVLDGHQLEYEAISPIFKYTR